MEDKKSRSPSPPTAETEKPSEEASTPEKDGVSLSGSDKLSEKNVSAAVEDFLPEARETDTSHCKEPHEGREHTLPEANAPVEEETQQSAKEEEEEEERNTEAAAAPPTEQESDLEAEYDNVEIGDGRVAGAPAEAAPDTRRLSASSGDSHSSRGADTARTDPHTQSPMSTSPTPPPSLEPASESVRSSPPPASATTPTSSSNNNNASPRSQPSNNNAYSSSSVVVVVMTGSTLPAASTTATTTTSPRSQPNNNAANSSGLNLNMSAAEMRAKLASRKKADPRKETVDLKKKYEIIQNM